MPCGVRIWYSNYMVRSTLAIWKFPSRRSLDPAGLPPGCQIRMHFFNFEYQMMSDRIGAQYTQFIYMSLHFRRATFEIGRLFTVTGQQLFDIHAAAFFRKFEKFRFSSFELRFLNLRIANPIREAVSIGCVNQWFVDHKFRKSKISWNNEVGEGFGVPNR